MRTQRGVRSLFVAVLALGLAVVNPVSSTAQDLDRVNPAAHDFVRLQYNDFLARSPDAAGLDFWARRIKSGEDPANLIDSMVSAPEFAETVAPLARLYQAYFLRTPDFDGLTFWTGRLRAGQSLSQVSSTFAASPEFEARYGSLSNADFVGLIYNNVLERQPDQAGLDFWVARLDAGASRGSVMLGFSESQEYVTATFGQVRASMLYLGMLRRTPDPDGLEFWAARIDAGQAYGSIVRGFLNSPEYQNRLATLFPVEFPLTGEATAAPQNRPALAIKIDNVPNARPQVGIEQADIIYEEMVEGNLTRLIAVFHSETPPQIGPVRSVRTSDFAILSAFNTPLLGASGANSVVLDLLDQYPIVNLNAVEAPSAYRRDNGRSAPHNLFTDPTVLWNLAPAQAGTPPALLDFRDVGEDLVPSATPAAGFDIDFGRTTASFRWNPARRGYVRIQDSTPHIDVGGLQYAPDNVILMTVPYGQSPADAESPEAVTIGAGRAWVFTAGNRLECFWSRSEATAPIRYTDGDGRSCELTPGSTWIALAPPGTATLR